MKNFIRDFKKMFFNVVIISYMTGSIVSNTGIIICVITDSILLMLGFLILMSIISIGIISYKNKKKDKIKQKIIDIRYIYYTDSKFMNTGWLCLELVLEYDSVIMNEFRYSISGLQTHTIDNKIKQIKKLYIGSTFGSFLTHKKNITEI